MSSNMPRYFCKVYRTCSEHIGGGACPSYLTAQRSHMLWVCLKSIIVAITSMHPFCTHFELSHLCASEIFNKNMGWFHIHLCLSSLINVNTMYLCAQFQKSSQELSLPFEAHCHTLKHPFSHQQNFHTKAIFSLGL